MAKKYEFKPDKPRSGFLSKLFLTQKQRRALLKWSLYALVLVVTSLFQDVMFSRLNFYGGTTELVPCAIFLVCIMEGVETGGVFALVASLGYLFSGSAAGYYSVAFITILAILVAAFRQGYLQRGFSTVLLCVAGAMLIYEMLVYCMTLFLGHIQPDNVLGFLMTAVLSLPAVPVLYPIFMSIGGGNTWNE